MTSVTKRLLCLVLRNSGYVSETELEFAQHKKWLHYQSMCQKQNLSLHNTKSDDISSLRVTQHEPHQTVGIEARLQFAVIPFEVLALFLVLQNLERSNTGGMFTCKE